MFSLVDQIEFDNSQLCYGQTIITEAFELARAGGQTDESRFYGMLLNYLFPFEDRGSAMEQSKSVDFTTVGSTPRRLQG